MRIIVASAALAAVLGGAPALAQSAVGEWDTVAETPQGDFESVMTITATDDGYDVTFVDQAPPGAPGPMPESTISNVVVEGDTFSFQRSMSTPQGAFELSYEGTVDGDTMSGTANSSFGAIPFSGARK